MRDDATTLGADEFYAELTLRNRGFVGPAAQTRLRDATVLVAGCGSTGGAAVEPLVRLGVQRFLLAEPGSFELNNLNRQHASVADIGRNKAEVSAERVRAVNPFAVTEVFDRGIEASNAHTLVRRSTVVVDGVDVTERSGWHAKFLLHEAAAAAGRPVVTGWDMGGTQYVRFYDYRAGDRPLAGRVTREQVESASAWALMRAVVPLRVVPVEMLERARRQMSAQLNGEAEEGLPQLVHTSMLFGALAARITLSLLEGLPVRRHTVVDSDRTVGTYAAGWRRRGRKPVVLGLALRDLARLRRLPVRDEGDGA